MADPPRTTEPRSKRPVDDEEQPQPMAVDWGKAAANSDADDPEKPHQPPAPASPHARGMAPSYGLPYPSVIPSAAVPPPPPPPVQPAPVRPPGAPAYPEYAAAMAAQADSRFAVAAQAERDREKLIADVARAVQQQSPPPKPPRWFENISGPLAVLVAAGTVFGTTYTLRGEVSEVKTSVNDLRERSKILDETAKAVTELRVQSLQADNAMQLQLVQITTKLDNILERLNRLETRR